MSESFQSEPSAAATLKIVLEPMVFLEVNGIVAEKNSAKLVKIVEIAVETTIVMLDPVLMLWAGDSGHHPVWMIIVLALLNAGMKMRRR
jgi:hypothetical protein